MRRYVGEDVTFNPNKTTRVAQYKVDRALFWYDVKLYAKFGLIAAAFMALALWILLYLMDRV